MNRIALKIFPLLALILLASVPARAQQMRTVVQVIDGGTLLLDGNQTVVLLGAQAPAFPQPEIGKDGKPKKPDSLAVGFATRSQQFTEGMLAGRQVWLEFDQTQTNNQGQTLAYVYFKIDSAKTLGGGGGKVLMTSGTYMLNRLLVEYGFATSGSSYPFKYRAQFDQLEQAARQQRIGLYQSNF